MRCLHYCSCCFWIGCWYPIILIVLRKVVILVIGLFFLRTSACLDMIAGLKLCFQIFAYILKHPVTLYSCQYYIRYIWSIIVWCGCLDLISQFISLRYYFFSAQYILCCLCIESLRRFWNCASLTLWYLQQCSCL